MNISLDYDNTYTRDPLLWNAFLRMTEDLGHTIYCVTMRYDFEGHDVRAALDGRVDYIFFTGRKAKKDFMFEQGIAIDVWIDDMPFFVLNDASS
jgi:hypothetical protein